MYEKQDTQMNKSGLPTKTKITIVWIVAFSISTILAFFIIVAQLANDMDRGADTVLWALCLAVFLPLLILLLLPAILLPVKKRWCWITSIIILGFEIVSSIATLVVLGTGDDFNITGFIPGIMVYVVPFILIVLDRKNYFEVVYQRELEKHKQN